MSKSWEHSLLEKEQVNENSMVDNFQLSKKQRGATPHSITMETLLTTPITREVNYYFSSYMEISHLYVATATTVIWAP